MDDTVMSYFPDYWVKRGEKTIYDVTIKDLLTMRAPYKGSGDPWTKVCSSPDWAATSLDFLGGQAGVTGEFSYRTVCLHILSGILSRATGMNAYLTDDSERFHAHLGYSTIGTFHDCGYKFERWYDMIWMEKMIGEHDCHPAEIIPFREIQTLS